MIRLPVYSGVGVGQRGNLSAGRVYRPKASSWYQNGPSLLEAIDETGYRSGARAVWGTRFAVQSIAFDGDFGGQLMLTGAVTGGHAERGHEAALCCPLVSNALSRA